MSLPPKKGKNQKLCLKLQQSLGVSHHCASGPKVIINGQQGKCPEAQENGEGQSQLLPFKPPSPSSRWRPLLQCRFLCLY